MLFAHSGGSGTVITDQGSYARPMDNKWLDNTSTSDRIAGSLIYSGSLVHLYFRGDHTSQVYSPDLIGKPAYIDFIYHAGINIPSICLDITFDPIGDEGELTESLREWMLGDFARQDVEYVVLDDEFERLSDEYLYELLYTNPEYMILGEPEDSTYINFFNYLVDPNVAAFTEISELINEDDINQALMENGLIVATTVMDVNRQLTNEIYLSTIAQDAMIDSAQYTTLLNIALTSPYIGGTGVYTARAILGIDAEDYGLAYRFANTDKAPAHNIIKLKPNPTKTQLYYTLPKDTIGYMKITIIDIYGRSVLKETKTIEKEGRIDVSSLANGMYLLKVNLFNEQYVSRFIKK